MHRKGRRPLAVALAGLLLAVSAWAQPAGQDLAAPPEPGQIQTTRPIESIQVYGNLLVGYDELRPLLAKYEGRRLSLAEMERLTKEIESLYQQKGYFLINALIPGQETTSGTLEVLVVEGKIGEVVVEGNQRYPTSFLVERFTAAVPVQGTTIGDFQKALFLLNELPDLNMQVVLTPGLEEGTTTVVLTAEEDKNYHFTTGYNNFGARLTGEHRFALGADFSSLLTPGDQLIVGGLLSTPADNTLFMQGAYSFPVGKAGTRLGFQYANGAYTAGREVAVLDIRGDADIFALTASHPLARSLSHSSTLDFRLAHVDLYNEILGTTLSRDQYMSASLGYSGEWRDSSGRFLGSANVTKGLGGTRRGDPLASRFGAGADFTKYNLDIARVQEFSPQWLAVLRGSMQFTADPLFSAEQFALGGPDTVRGFSQAETLGDQAYNATLELRWSPLTEQPELFQTVAFIDHGAVTRKLTLPGEDGSEKLTGAGVGFRLNFDETRLRLDIGFPISPSTNLRGNSPVVYGQIQTRF